MIVAQTISLMGSVAESLPMSVPMVVREPTRAPITTAIVPAFLAGLGHRDLTIVLNAAEHRRIAAGQVVIRSGERARHLYLMRAGSAKYYRLTKNGEEVLLWSLSPGDVFGLGTIFANPLRYIGSAETLPACEVDVWAHARIREFARDYPQLAENALRIVLQYLSNHADRLVSLVSHTAEQKVAWALLHLSRRTGRIHPHGVEVKVTNDHLGALANVSPFTASRFLSKWERSGAVVKTRGKVFIHSPEQLVVE
jgi:CRP-like cAMP-binding protein